MISAFEGIAMLQTKLVNNTRIEREALRRTIHETPFVRRVFHRKANVAGDWTWKSKHQRAADESHSTRELDIEPTEEFIRERFAIFVITPP